VLFLLVFRTHISEISHMYKMVYICVCVYVIQLFKYLHMQ